MDNKELEQTLLEGSEQVQSGAPCEIDVQGKTYKVRQISQDIGLKISNLEKEVLVLEREAKGEITLKRAKQIDKKMYTLHSKTAAYYLLGNWALIKPLWSLVWRWLFRKTNEVTFRINDAGANNKDVETFLKNKAVLFDKQGFSKTHLIYTSYKNEMVLVGYYALAHKSFVIKSSSKVSSSLKKRIAKFGQYDKDLKQYVVSAPLIGQLGKNE